MGGSRSDRRRSRQIRVALVEPRTGLPDELEAALQVHPRIIIVSRSSSVGQALDEAMQRAPDVVIVDAGSLSDAVRGGEPVVALERGEGPASELTPRERQVIALVAEGRTSREIASLLRVTPRTVEAHRENIGRKLGIRTVAAFTRFAIAHGILETD
jgi:DNA-binding NarL/FixJ family response regulator